MGGFRGPIVSHVQSQGEREREHHVYTLQNLRQALSPSPSSPLLRLKGRKGEWESEERKGKGDLLPSKRKKPSWAQLENVKHHCGLCGGQKATQHTSLPSHEKTFANLGSQRPWATAALTSQSSFKKSDLGDRIIALTGERERNHHSRERASQQSEPQTSTAAQGPPQKGF